MLSLLTVLLLAAVAAAAQTSNVTAKADVDFVRVETARDLKLADAIECVHSQAALAAVAGADQKYRAFFRRGYCQILTAALSKDTGAWEAAARDFQQAIAVWPASEGAAPSGLRVMVPIAKLEGGRKADSYGEASRDLAAALASGKCTSSPAMTGPFCESLADAGRNWLIWLAWRRRNLDEARRLATAGSGWASWLDGFAALERGQPAEAEKQMTSALAAWNAAREMPAGRLGPPADEGSIHVLIGQAQFGSGHHAAAAASFTRALTETSRQASTLYLRARSLEATGDIRAAVEGYGSAADMARETNDTTWPIGEASVRRGMLEFRAGAFAAAEADFTLALTAPLGEFTRSDVDAWRAWAGASQGGCQTSDLSRALTQVTTRFPKRDAEGLVFRCQLGRAATLDQLTALESAYGGALAEADLGALRKRIGAAFAERGVAADDRRETAEARNAYQKALEYDPSHAKARFNLGAIYFESKQFELAEAEYRALTQLAAGDHEAQFWLGASILAQKPDEGRKAEACGWLKQAVQTESAEQKAEFQKTLSSAVCK